MSNNAFAFTATIQNILREEFGEFAEIVFNTSPLLQYLNIKTRSASSGAKARGSFANHYALYVLIEDYIKQTSEIRIDYADYDGANFSDLFKRQRELPFGQKLQNHALNDRLNGEFRGMFPTLNRTPILRDLATNRYWINEALLKVAVSNGEVNIAKAIIRIIDAYIAAKQDAFQKFIQDCEDILRIVDSTPEEALAFIKNLLRPNVDARIFEIVSYAILKVFYADTEFFWGWNRADIRRDFLTLYKTGRTNANDGGIDFIMKPIGRIFQVTETTDVRKYFLDIDKVQKFPITFVIKSEETPDTLRQLMRKQAMALYPIEHIVERYMESVEEIINIPLLVEYVEQVFKRGKFAQLIDEVILQSRVEFNYQAPN